jgi:hypothetical protein
MGNLAWTNVSKVGLILGNPGPSQIDEQYALAVETLQREVADLKPTIVVAVSSRFGESIFRAAVDGTNDADWLKSEDEKSLGVDDVWWKPGKNNNPSLLWMRHPQGAKPELRAFALKKIRELVH